MWEMLISLDMDVLRGSWKEWEGGAVPGAAD